MSDYALFPFGQVESGSRIIIYGAGLAGRNMYLQVKKTSYAEVICFVDKAAKQIELYEIDVCLPEYLKDFSDYDYVIVSLMDEKLKYQVSQDLLRIFNVPEEKVIVPRNNIINWEYGFNSLTEENKYSEMFPQYLKKISPKELISADRIDVAVRYILFRDFINDVENLEHISLIINLLPFSRTRFVFCSCLKTINLFSISRIAMASSAACLPPITRNKSNCVFNASKSSCFCFNWAASIMLAFVKAFSTLSCSILISFKSL